VRPRTLCRVSFLALLLIAAAAGSALAARHYSARLPKRFGVVVAGKLYRGGSVTPAQLERLHRDYGIRRVVCLLDTAAPQTQAERQAAERLGIDWHNVPLPGNGASRPAERSEILRLLSDPGTGPTLVHCGAGTNRTGLAIGLYRLHAQGWTLDQVMQELRAFDFEDDPQHENLRQALATEAAAAASARARTPQPSSAP
jgi:protein tyrosine/serine phosphatase